MKLSIADLNPQLRQWTGPLTRELILEPGRFGLGRIPAKQAPDSTTRIVCGFCSTGCGLTAHLKNGEAVNLSADADYPVNLGMACPKGWEALAPLAAPDRGTTPLLRSNAGELVEIDWHRAMTEFCARFKALQTEHGRESIAFLSTGQFCTEEMALLGALFKFGMGGVHCDSNTRQCMATTHVAYKESFGFDAPPFTYADFELSDVLVFIGANPCIAHPIMWQRVMRNPNKPEIIVIDPRVTETAMAATRHFPLRPKSDLTLLYGVARALIKLGAVDGDFVADHTAGFNDFAAFVEPFDPGFVSQETGLAEADILQLAQIVADGKRVSFWWTMGVNQSHEATRTAQAIVNLALMTGNIGRPGTGANSITGQCNAMGSRIFSNITSLIGGHDFSNSGHRQKVARTLQIPEALLPEQPGWAYDQIVDGIRAGKIRGLWVIATNNSHSWIHQRDFNECLSKLDFLVVQDLYPTTETAQRAHLYLPAAGWGEKEGTLINSERRIGLVKKIRRAPGRALADFHIFKLIAEYWGCGELFAHWHSPEAAFQIIKQLSRGLPCEITGIRDYRMLDECGGIQWPWPESRQRQEHFPPTERRLFEDGRFFTHDGRAQFRFDAPRPVSEAVDGEYPFVLLTGRGSSAQWHTGSRTNKSDVLRALAPAECYVEINAADAKRLLISAQQTVRIASRSGSILAKAVVTPIVQPGHLFVPMHYPEVNQLIARAFDPHSRQPSYKYTPVKIAPEA